MLKEIILAIKSYFEAHRFILKYRLWKWILVPGLIYSLLFVTGFYFFWTSSNEAIDWLLRQTGVGAYLIRLQESWLNFFFLIGEIFIHLLLLVGYFSLFKYIFLIIGAPLFAFLSEKTACILLGTPFKFDAKQWYSDAIRGMLLAIRNMRWQLLYMLALIIISFVPIVGWVTPLVVLFIDSYYMGFSMLDYTCERNQLNIEASIQLISHHKGLAIGNGLVFYLIHMIPLIGWVVAPTYAVVAATMSLHKTESR
jgi:CysZ protein